MLLLLVLVGGLILLFYKRPVYTPPNLYTPPMRPFIPPPMQQPLVPPAGVPQAQQSAQGSAPIARAATFAPPPVASSGAFAAPPDPATIKPAPLPPPVDLNDVFRRPSA